MRLGTTAFSFTNEWLTRRYTLEQLLEEVAERDLGPGIELIGYQAWRSYPALSDPEVLAFRQLCDELGLEPAALGGYVDLARRVDRLVTNDEAVELLRAQIETAHRLGFPVLRLHLGIPVRALEELAAFAERRGVTLATEVQGAQAPDHPAVAPVLELRELLGSPAVALALDFTVSMSTVPGVFVEALGHAGMAGADVAGLVELWAGGASTRELLAAIGEIDAPAAALDEARAGFFRFGRQAPRSWLPFVSEIAYAHAKFWELDDRGDDPTVRTAELLQVLAEGGYEGVVASEWGGSAWKDADEVDGFDVVGRHHALCTRLLGDAGRSVDPDTDVLPVGGWGIR